MRRLLLSALALGALLPATSHAGLEVSSVEGHAPVADLAAGPTSFTASDVVSVRAVEACVIDGARPPALATVNPERHTAAHAREQAPVASATASVRAHDMHPTSPVEDSRPLAAAAKTTFGHGHDAAAGECHPTPEQAAAAAKLVEDVRAALTRKFDVPEKALLAGYQRGTEADYKAHYYNWAEQKSARVLDPERPEGIVYNGHRVIGALFMMPRRDDVGPRPGGCLTTWHRHTLKNGEVTAESLHVWIVDNPSGPFAERAPTER